MTKKCSKKKLSVIHWMNTGIFPATVMFSCGFKYDEMMGILKKKKLAEGWYGALSESKTLIDSGTWFGLYRHFKGKNYFYIIITDHFKFTDWEYCKLAHEVLHICQFFLPDVLNRDREYECEAYLHTHLMRQCIEVLRKKKIN